VVTVGTSLGPELSAGGEQRRRDSGRRRQAQSCQLAADFEMPFEDSHLPGMEPRSAQTATVLGPASYPSYLRTERPSYLEQSVV
jgi:hypothetical protein